jgi:hypothetical protein
VQQRESREGPARMGLDPGGEVLQRPWHVEKRPRVGSARREAASLESHHKWLCCWIPGRLPRNAPE